MAVTISGDEATIDLAGSSPQRQCGMNVYYNYTYAYVMCAMRAVTDPFVPHNEGCTRPVNLVAPKGCSDAVRWAREIKAGGYLSKPLTIDELLAVVEHGGSGDPSR